MVYYPGVPVVHIAPAEKKSANLSSIIDYQVEFKPLKPTG
jgi:hypothetical protein